MDDELRQKANFIIAQKRIGQIRDFYSHLIIYCTVNILFFIFWLLDTHMPKTFWEPAFFMMLGGAGFVVLAHGIFVFGAKYILPKGWEEKKINELMSKQNRQNKKYE